jgi:hypothetical protein
VDAHLIERIKALLPISVELVRVVAQAAKGSPGQASRALRACFPARAAAAQFLHLDVKGAVIEAGALDSHLSRLCGSLRGERGCSAPAQMRRPPSGAQRLPERPYGRVEGCGN